MATNVNKTADPSPAELPVDVIWINFINSVKLLLVPRAKDRPLDQYLELRNKVLALVQEKAFLDALTKCVNGLSVDYHEVAEALLAEVKAFTLAVEVAREIGKPEKKEKWWKRWGQSLLSRASTVTGSMKDFAENDPKVKNGLILFKELIDIFKG